MAGLAAAVHAFASPTGAATYGGSSAGSDAFNQVSTLTQQMLDAGRLSYGEAAALLQQFHQAAYPDVGQPIVEEPMLLSEAQAMANQTTTTLNPEKPPRPPPIVQWHSVRPTPGWKPDPATAAPSIPDAPPPPVAAPHAVSDVNQTTLLSHVQPMNGSADHDLYEEDDYDATPLVAGMAVGMAAAASLYSYDMGGAGTAHRSLSGRRAAAANAANDLSLLILVTSLLS
jgi:hypothetical protein